MNKYQAKLEAIQARRLNLSQRTFSLLASASLLCAAFWLLPTAFLAFADLFSYERAPLIKTFGSMSGLIAIGAIPSLLYLVYFCFSWCLKHFVRFLSGIKET